MQEDWEIHWKDYYEILQVHHSAEPEVIEGAYKKLVKKYHPDVNKDPAAGEKTSQINVAYKVLSDPEKRKRYHSAWLKENRKTDGWQGATVENPKPVVDPERLYFKDVEPKEVKKASFIVRNAGGPYIKIWISNPDSWVKVVSWASLTTSDELPLEVKIEAEGKDWEKSYLEYIRVKLDEEETQVKIELQTKPEPVRVSSIPKTRPTPSSPPPPISPRCGVFSWPSWGWQLAGLILTAFFGLFFGFGGMIVLERGIIIVLMQGEYFNEFRLIGLGLLTLVGYSAFKTTFFKNVSTASLAVKIGVGIATIYGPILILIIIFLNILILNNILDPFTAADISDIVVYFTINVSLAVSGFLLLYEIWARLKGFLPAWQCAGLILTAFFGLFFGLFGISEFILWGGRGEYFYRFLLFSLSLLTLVGYSTFKVTFLKNVSTAPLAVKVGVGIATIYGPIFLSTIIFLNILSILDPTIRDIVLYSMTIGDIVLYFAIAIPLIVSVFLLLYEIWTRLR